MALPNGHYSPNGEPLPEIPLVTWTPRVNQNDSTINHRIIHVMDKLGYCSIIPPVDLQEFRARDPNQQLIHMHTYQCLLPQGHVNLPTRRGDIKVFFSYCLEAKTFVVYVEDNATPEVTFCQVWQRCEDKDNEPQMLARPFVGEDRVQLMTSGL